MPEHISDHGTMVATHWNVHSWSDADGITNVDAVSEFLTATAPDIVSLVEVDESSPAAPVLSRVTERTGYCSVFVPAFSYGDERVRGCFGNAILTRLPILAVRQHSLLWPEPVYDGTERSEPRALLLVLVQCGDEPVWCGSVHLPRKLVSARDAALTRLRSIVMSLDEPWLVLGDFNAPATSWLTDAPNLAAHPTEPIATYPADAPREAIDYAIGPRDQLVEARVLETKGSDHLPVTVRFDVHGARPT